MPTYDPAPAATPITGKEFAGTPDSPVQAIAQFYAAFNGRDAALMAANWDADWPVSNENQLGGILRSRAEVIDRYAAIFKAPFKVYAEFADYTVMEADTFFIAVGHERGTFEADGESFPFQTRDTRVFRRDGPLWRQVHHHGSFEDSALMAKFQAAAKAEPG